MISPKYSRWLTNWASTGCLFEGKYYKKAMIFAFKHRRFLSFFINRLSIRTFRGSCLSPLLFAVIYQVELEPPLLFLLWMEPYQGICRDKGFISQHALLCLFLCQVLCWVRVWVVLGWFFLFSWCACVVLCRVVLGHVKSVSPTCAHLAVRCCVRLLRFVSPPCLLDAAALVGSLCPFPVPLREVPDFKPQRRSHGYVIVGVMIGQCGKSTQNRIHPNSQHI